MNQYNFTLPRFCFLFLFNVNISLGASYQVWKRTAAAAAPFLLVLLGQLKELALTFERLGFGDLLLTSVGEPGQQLAPDTSDVKEILDDQKE